MPSTNSMMVQSSASFEDVLRRMREAVLRDAARRGGQLPTERALAEALGASRGTVRKALARLEADGLIWRGVGRGTYLKGHEPVAPPGAGLVTSATNPAEVMETRLVLEPEIAALAVAKATPLQIERLEAIVREGRGARDAAAFERADSAFHEGLARAVGNEMLLGLFLAVNAARAGRLWGRLKAASVTPERIAAYSDQHAAVLGALRERDREGAAGAMRDHLQTVRLNLLG